MGLVAAKSSALARLIYIQPVSKYSQPRFSRAAKKRVERVVVTLSGRAAISYVILRKTSCKGEDQPRFIGYSVCQRLPRHIVLGGCVCESSCTGFDVIGAERFRSKPNDSQRRYWCMIYCTNEKF